jgi:pentose-5-phosphate-3-epimerase
MTNNTNNDNNTKTQQKGSSHLHLGLSDRPLHAPGMFGSYDGALLPGLHVVEGGQTSTGSALAWLRGRVLNAGGGQQQQQAAAVQEQEQEETEDGGAEKRQKTDAAPPVAPAGAAGLSYARLDALAAAIAPGSDGLLALDHFQGNRTPHTDARSRGAVAGLTLAHGPGHLHRSLLEAVCFGTEAVLEAMRAAGFRPSALSVAGGATRSPLWLQMHADVSGLPLSVPCGASDAPALGCAILAAAAAGFHGGDVVRAAKAMVRVDRTLRPSPESAHLYVPVYARWKMLYPALKPIFHSDRDVDKDDKDDKGDASAAALASLPLVAAALKRRVAVAPSLLAADFANLSAELARLEEGWPTDASGGGGGVDADADEAAAAPDASAHTHPSPSPHHRWSPRRWLHFDMFDGSLNTQVTFGAPLLQSLRPVTGRLVDVHLIAREPGEHFAQLKAAGADTVTLQYENVVVGGGGGGGGKGGETDDAEEEEAAVARLRALCAQAKETFGSVGVALALGTPAEVLRPLLLPVAGAGGAPPAIDRALVMSVPLGFGGLKFQGEEALAKVRALRAMGGERLVITVDGGIGAAEAALLAEAGANVLVAGSSVFRAKGGVPAAEAERAVLRAAAEGAAARSRGAEEAVVVA